MKTILIIAAMAISATAMAGEFTYFGKIHFQKASTWVPANYVCSESGFLYHKKKDFAAVQYCNEDGNNCKTVMKALVQPMKSTRQRCSGYSGGNCTSWETVSYNQGTVTAKVYAGMNDMDKDVSPLSTFKYTVEPCNGL